jgi:nicotinate-nucleotide adenylyltransferase
MRLGIFGGSFDPIHYGHLRTALELQQRLSLSEVRFIPCADPPHRSDAPVAGLSRIDMVRAAIAGEPTFVVDEREFERDGPSYTVDTLRSFREESPTVSLCLLMGMDAFLGLPGWHQWQEILQLSHLIVAHRPGWEAPTEGPLGELLLERRTSNVSDLTVAECGSVYVTPVTQLEISATELRDSLRAGLDPKYLMPDSVRQLLIESGCYAKDN